MQLSEVARLRAIYLTATMAIAAVGIISMQSGGHSRTAAPTELASLRQVAVLNALARQQMLFGGDGLVTTGDYVDGRRTTPGLHTNCIPGVLRSDCSPAQEDGAWSTEAAKYIDDHTGGGHSHTMEDVQKNVNRAFAAKDAYLKACLQDWRNCNKPSELVTGFNDNIDDQSDAATYGITAHPWANLGKPSLKYSGVAPPDQYSEYNPNMDDGSWNDVVRPSGHQADKSGLVSTAYWSVNAKPGHVF
mmetsp:Transcript_32707/g.77064  ORF Transcript_32707/g.77064 Transcript_32707/m.77064 type:complete len:246 (+) Transcript_32707:172-909(+)